MDRIRVASTAAGIGDTIDGYRDLKRARYSGLITDWHRENKLVFIHVPKSAGTAIRHAIADPTPIGFGHTTARTYQTIDPEFFKTAYSFAVLRDPIERFYSACSHIRTQTLDHHDPLLNQAEDILDWDRFVERFEASRWYRSKIFASLHFKPQWFTVCDRAGAPLVTELFAFEHMDEKMRPTLEKRLGRKIALSRANVSTRHDDKFELSENALQWVRRFFARDFDLYRRALGSH